MRTFQGESFLDPPSTHPWKKRDQFRFSFGDLFRTDRPIGVLLSCDTTDPNPLAWSWVEVPIPQLQNGPGKDGFHGAERSTGSPSWNRFEPFQESIGAHLPWLFGILLPGSRKGFTSEHTRTHTLNHKHMCIERERESTIWHPAARGRIFFAALYRCTGFIM